MGRCFNILEEWKGRRVKSEDRRSEIEDEARGKRSNSWFSYGFRDGGEGWMRILGLNEEEKEKEGRREGWKEKFVYIGRKEGRKEKR